MKQKELDLLVALSTRESLAEIRRRGFCIETPGSLLELDLDEANPQYVDWDALDHSRYERSLLTA